MNDPTPKATLPLQERGAYRSLSTSMSSSHTSFDFLSRTENRSSCRLGSSAYARSQGKKGSKGCPRHVSLKLPPSIDHQPPLPLSPWQRHLLAAAPPALVSRVQHGLAGGLLAVGNGFPNEPTASEGSHLEGLGIRSHARRREWWSFWQSNLLAHKQQGDGALLFVMA
jgi:hypothetical protein